MIPIIYDSKTGNVRRFVDKVNAFDVHQLDPDSAIDFPYVLVTYTNGFGQVPDTTKQFLQKNGSYLQAVAASGNRVWGERFALSADRIANTYDVPILHKFELSGTRNDVETFIEEVERLGTTNRASAANITEMGTIKQ